ncbi:hypothetical protein BJ165DRAFT_1533773 [Panaeolus papilionaceus]|nr:hypothetical protein BJ165DRAFT_1533773 [Panaeolus papilionaceus]
MTWLQPQRSKSTILWTTNLVASFQKPNPQPCFNILCILERDNNTLSDKDAIWRRTWMSGHGEIMNLFSVSLYPSIGNEDADAWHDNILPHAMPRTTLCLTPVHPSPPLAQVSEVLITPNHCPPVVHSHPTNGRAQDGFWSNMDVTGQRVLVVVDLIQNCLGYTAHPP